MWSCFLAMSLAMASIGADKCAVDRAAANANEPWPLTLAYAIQIAAENSENSRTLEVSNQYIVGCFEPRPAELMGLTDCPDKQETWIAIAPIDHNRPLSQFRADITALVRTVEERYWALHERTVECWARRKAVELVQREVSRRKREQQSLGLASAERRLDQFRLDLETASAERTAAEWRLRNAMGVPIADGPTIVPATMPIDRKVELSRDACLALVNSNNSTTAARETLSRCLEQVASRYQALIDATNAKRLAESQLSNQYMELEKNEHSLDGYVEAIGAYVAASLRKVHAKSSYTSALSALEEIKGTLLELRAIEIRSSPGKVKRIIQRRSPAKPAEPSTAKPPVTGPNAEHAAR